MKLTIPLPSNWKTTAVGLLAAAYSFFQLYMIHDWSHFLNEVVFNPTVLLGFLLALLGWQTKDKNATGGTEPVTPEAVSRVETATKPPAVP